MSVQHANETNKLVQLSYESKQNFQSEEELIKQAFEVQSFDFCIQLRAETRTGIGGKENSLLLKGD